ncbi:MAG: SAM-dependent methyltransferase [Planctomycetota bacterium]
MYDGRYVGRGGKKLEFALDKLQLSVHNVIAADFGCNIGGFTDCLLQRGAKKVYAVDTGYGMLEWKLRKDDRVVVMERTNAMHVDLPEPVKVVTIDAGWTRQKYILPNALAQGADDALILSLFKPQYEADDSLVHDGVVPSEHFQQVLDRTLCELNNRGFVVDRAINLPHERKSKNREAMLLFHTQHCTPDG